MSPSVTLHRVEDGEHPAGAEDGAGSHSGVRRLVADATYFLTNGPSGQTTRP
jgi:hypothetical protein